MAAPMRHATDQHAPSSERPLFCRSSGGALPVTRPISSVRQRTFVVLRRALAAHCSPPFPMNLLNLLLLSGALQWIVCIIQWPFGCYCAFGAFARNARLARESDRITIHLVLDPIMHCWLPNAILSLTRQPTI